jgi:hypothetical protein
MSAYGPGVYHLRTPDAPLHAEFPLTVPLWGCYQRPNTV